MLQPPFHRGGPGRLRLRAGAFLWLVLAGLRPAGALDPGRDLTQYARLLWQRVDGLPQNAVTALQPSSSGYLWLGTQEGLVRFDGVAFTIFDSANTDVFEDHFVTALAEGADGSLWIGTRRGLVRETEGRFERFGAEVLPEEYVRALYLDRRGRLWVGTYGGGLAVHEEGRWRVFGEAEGLPDLTVRALLEDREGQLWVGTSHGLARLHGDAFTTWTSADGLPSDFVRALAEDAEGRLWVGTERGGLARLEPDGQVTPMELGPDFETVGALHTDRDGNLWIGTPGRGLGRLRAGSFSVWTAAEGLAHDVVWCFAEDAEGSLWVGTRGGLLQLRDGNVKPLAAAQGLSDDFVRAVFEDRDGWLWIGTEGGVDRLRDGVLEPLTLPRGSAGEEVRAITQDRHGAVWLGTRESLIRIGGSSRTTFTVADGLPAREVNALAEDVGGSLWIGTGGGGLVRLEDGRFTTFTTAEGLPSDVIRALLADPDGSLWVGTEAGLAHFDGEAFAIPGAGSILERAIVLSLYRDARGVLWIGTSGDGLFRLAEGRIRQFTKEQGLFNDLVFQILEDAEENLWMSSQQGISRLARSELERIAEGGAGPARALSLNEADGMVSAECNGGSQPAGWKARDGRLWFPTISGLAAVDPGRLRRNEVPPPVLVEQLLVDGEEVAGAPGRVPRLPAGSRGVELRYTAPSFVSPQKVRFRYRLEGFHDEWVAAGGRRVAFFTNLPPGRYRFQVIAANSDGVWNEVGASLAFRQLPFFYQTPWFYAVCGLGVALLAFASYQLRIRRLTALQEDLIRLVDQRTLELAEANRALERLALVDSVTGVANHRRFQEALEEEWRRAIRVQIPISLLMIDVDFFKRYNDTYGHQQGDVCLHRVAGALAAEVRRPGDLVARYGGEEFAAILPGAGESAARALAERMRRAVEELGVAHTASQVADHVSVSIGVATAIPQLGSSPDALLAVADRALYRAKREGRNQVC